MRERCFSVLGDRVAGARVLDLFAGTGAVGIEALSRGAASALFVDNHRSAVSLIRRNLVSLGLDDHRTLVIQRPAERAVADLTRRGDRFDLIWADPPFERWLEGLEVVIAAVEAGLATAAATLCLECPAEADVGPRLDPRLDIERDLVGGASRVVILRQR
jgi:16S rRNA (guanine(966)-N(2))-methyltransferase RsmD